MAIREPITGESNLPPDCTRDAGDPEVGAVDGVISGSLRGSTPLDRRYRTGGRRGTRGDCQSRDDDECERHPERALHSHRLSLGAALASFNASSGDIAAL